MHYEISAALIGVLLTAMTLTQSFDRIPISSAMAYLLVGVAVRPLWLGLANLTIASSAEIIERAFTFAVLEATYG